MQIETATLPSPFLDNRFFFFDLDGIDDHFVFYVSYQWFKIIFYSNPLIKMNSDLQLTTDDSIGRLVIDTMHVAESDRSMSGQDKKLYVLKVLRMVMGVTIFGRYAPLLEILIDLIVSISRKEIDLILNKNSICLFGLCK